MIVLALLDLQNLNLASQLQVFPQQLHFLFIFLLQLLDLAFILLAKLGHILVVLLLQFPYGILVCKFQLFQFQLQRSLVALRFGFMLPVFLLLKLQCHFTCACVLVSTCKHTKERTKPACFFQLRNIILMLVEQMLYLLFVNLDLDLMALLKLLHLTIRVSEFCLPIFQLLLCNLPEGIDLIALKLEVVPFLSLMVKFQAQMKDGFFQLFLTHFFTLAKRSFAITLFFTLALFPFVTLAAFVLLLRSTALEPQSQATS
mmetsp:Transcript_39800/g.104504  ORF Transcript_39800/g.104504 Transcript_39800/m.104504 type:complete len:258 (-) Transcript_39800:69-842(-)